MRKKFKETTGAIAEAITPRKTAVGDKNVAKVERAMAREKNLSRTTAGERRRAIAIPDWTLYVPIEVWNLIVYLQQEIRIEFGFDGVVSLVEGKKRAFRLEKLVIPEQEVTEGSIDYLESTVNLVSIEERSKLIFHGHSHGDLNAFWSGIDERDIGNWSGDYYLNIVINNRGKVLGRIDFFVEIPGSGINEHVGVANLRLVLEFSDDYKKEHAQTVSKITASQYAPAASNMAMAMTMATVPQRQLASLAANKEGQDEQNVRLLR